MVEGKKLYSNFRGSRTVLNPLVRITLASNAKAFLAVQAFRSRLGFPPMTSQKEFPCREDFRFLRKNGLAWIASTEM
jgi:hypothetical protein